MWRRLNHSCRHKHLLTSRRWSLNRSMYLWISIDNSWLELRASQNLLPSLILWGRMHFFVISMDLKVLVICAFDNLKLQGLVYISCVSSHSAACRWHLLKTRRSIFFHMQWRRYHICLGQTLSGSYKLIKEFISFGDVSGFFCMKGDDSQCTLNGLLVSEQIFLLLAHTVPQPTYTRIGLQARIWNSWSCVAHLTHTLHQRSTVADTKGLRVADIGLNEGSSFSHVSKGIAERHVRSSLSWCTYFANSDDVGRCTATHWHVQPLIHTQTMD